MVNFANSELVALAWMLEYVPGFTAPMLGTTLPRDPAAWAATGFVQAQTIPGRPASVDLPRRLPVVQVDSWAANVSGNQPPWWKAHGLADRVRIATENEEHPWIGKPLSLAGVVPNNAEYEDAIVWGVYPLIDPTRVPDDPAGYARVTIDLAFDWVRP